MNKAHLTAIARNKPSAPMRWLAENSSALETWMRKLDYGCGKGFDAERYDMFKYDPHYYPDKCLDYTGKYDTITCNYVLNVIESDDEVNKVLAHIRSLLKPDGVAYITVRRDVKQPGRTKRGTYQRDIQLDLESVYHKKNQYEIYRMVR